MFFKVVIFGCILATSSSLPSCTDANGNKVLEGEVFVPLKTDPCHKCTCIKGENLHCLAELCSPPTKCRHYIRLTGSCCEFKCLDEITYEENVINPLHQTVPKNQVVRRTCVDGNARVIKDGDLFKPVKGRPCLQCTCQDGVRRSCHVIHCNEQIKCRNFVRIDGSCCRFKCLDRIDGNTVELTDNDVDNSPITDSRSRTCIDSHGNVVQDGNLFVPHRQRPCLKCICVAGLRRTCTTVKCEPPKDCKRYEEVPEKCCKFRCLDEPEDNSIQKNSVEYYRKYDKTSLHNELDFGKELKDCYDDDGKLIAKDSETFGHGCDRCRCVQGEVTSCVSVWCLPPKHCKHYVPLPDECCKFKCLDSVGEIEDNRVSKQDMEGGKSLPKSGTCTSGNSDVIQSGKLFQPDIERPCFKCICLNGITSECSSVQCDPPNGCKVYRKVPSTCCDFECLDSFENMSKVNDDIESNDYGNSDGRSLNQISGSLLKEPSNHSSESLCVDIRGFVVEENEVFRPTGSYKCLECICKSGQPIMCNPMSCLPPQHCANYVQISGTCCEFKCIDSQEENEANNDVMKTQAGCFDSNGNVVKIGSLLEHPDNQPCSECFCAGNNDRFCKVKDCPDTINCSDVDVIRDACCKYKCANVTDHQTIRSESSVPVNKTGTIPIKENESDSSFQNNIENVTERISNTSDLQKDTIMTEVTDDNIMLEATFPTVTNASNRENSNVGKNAAKNTSNYIQYGDDEKEERENVFQKPKLIDENEFGKDDKARQNHTLSVQNTTVYSKKSDSAINSVNHTSYKRFEGNENSSFKVLNYFDKRYFNVSDAIRNVTDRSIDPNMSIEHTFPAESVVNIDAKANDTSNYLQYGVGKDEEHENEFGTDDKANSFKVLKRFDERYFNVSDAAGNVTDQSVHSNMSELDVKIERKVSSNGTLYLENMFVNDTNKETVNSTTNLRQNSTSVNQMVQHKEKIEAADNLNFALGLMRNISFLLHEREESTISTSKNVKNYTREEVFSVDIEIEKTSMDGRNGSDTVKIPSDNQISANLFYGQNNRTVLEEFSDESNPKNSEILNSSTIAETENANYLNISTAPKTEDTNTSMNMSENIDELEKMLMKVSETLHRRQNQSLNESEERYSQERQSAEHIDYVVHLLSNVSSFLHNESRIHDRVDVETEQKITYLVNVFQTAQNDTIQAIRYIENGLTCKDFEGNEINSGERFVPEYKEPCQLCICRSGLHSQCLGISCSRVTQRPSTKSNVIQFIDYKDDRSAKTSMAKTINNDDAFVFISLSFAFIYSKITSIN